MRDSSTAPLRVLVVGAGPSGLQVAQALKHAGVELCVLEQHSSIGGRWLRTAQSYGISSPLQVPWAELELNGFPWPARMRPAGEYATTGQALDYLHAYARHFGLQRLISLNSRVVGLQQVPGSNTWTATYIDATRQLKLQLDADYVILATGKCSSPHVPMIPGQGSFLGSQVHVKAVQDVALSHGHNVVVIGDGQEAMDCAAQLALAQSARSLTLVHSRPHWLVPRGSKAHKALTGQAAAAYVPPYYAAGVLSKLAHAAAAPVKKAFWSYWSSRLERPTALHTANAAAAAAAGMILGSGMSCSGNSDVLPGSPSAGGAFGAASPRTSSQTAGTSSMGRGGSGVSGGRCSRPGGGKLVRDLLSGGVVVVDLTWLMLLRSRKFKATQGQVSHITQEGVVLSDGTYLPCDLIVYATGYSCLPELIDKNDALSLGASNGRAPPLYRGMLPTTLPNLAILGYGGTGSCSTAVAGLQAQWLAAALSGTMRLPGRRAMRADVKAQEKWMSGLKLGSPQSADAPERVTTGCAPGSALDGGRGEVYGKQYMQQLAEDLQQSSWGQGWCGGSGCFAPGPDASESGSNSGAAGPDPTGCLPGVWRRLRQGRALQPDCTDPGPHDLHQEPSMLHPLQLGQVSKHPSHKSQASADDGHVHAGGRPQAGASIAPNRAYMLMHMDGASTSSQQSYVVGEGSVRVGAKGEGAYGLRGPSGNPGLLRASYASMSYGTSTIHSDRPSPDSLWGMNLWSSVHGGAGSAGMVTNMQSGGGAAGAAAAGGIGSAAGMDSSNAALSRSHSGNAGSWGTCTPSLQSNQRLGSVTAGPQPSPFSYSAQQQAAGQQVPAGLVRHSSITIGRRTLSRSRLGGASGHWAIAAGALDGTGGGPDAPRTSKPDSPMRRSLSTTAAAGSPALIVGARGSLPTLMRRSQTLDQRGNEDSMRHVAAARAALLAASQAEAAAAAAPGGGVSQPQQQNCDAAADGRTAPASPSSAMDGVAAAGASPQAAGTAAVAPEQQQQQLQQQVCQEGPWQDRSMRGGSAFADGVSTPGSGSGGGALPPSAVAMLGQTFERASTGGERGSGGGMAPYTGVALFGSVAEGIDEGRDDSSHSGRTHDRGSPSDHGRDSMGSSSEGTPGQMPQRLARVFHIREVPEGAAGAPPPASPEVLLPPAAQQIGPVAAATGGSIDVLTLAAQEAAAGDARSSPKLSGAGAAAAAGSPAQPLFAGPSLTARVSPLQQPHVSQLLAARTELLAMQSRAASCGQRASAPACPSTKGMDGALGSRDATASEHTTPSQHSHHRSVTHPGTPSNMDISLNILLQQGASSPQQALPVSSLRANSRHRLLLSVLTPAGPVPASGSSGGGAAAPVNSHSGSQTSAVPLRNDQDALVRAQLLQGVPVVKPRPMRRHTSNSGAGGSLGGLNQAGGLSPSAEGSMSSLMMGATGEDSQRQQRGSAADGSGSGTPGGDPQPLLRRALEGASITSRVYSSTGTASPSGSRYGRFLATRYSNTDRSTGGGMSAAASTAAALITVSPRSSMAGGPDSSMALIDASQLQLQLQGSASPGAPASPINTDSPRVSASAPTPAAAGGAGSGVPSPALWMTSPFQAGPATAAASSAYLSAMSAEGGGSPGGGSEQQHLPLERVTSGRRSGGNVVAPLPPQAPGPIARAASARMLTLAEQLGAVDRDSAPGAYAAGGAGEAVVYGKPVSSSSLAAAAAVQDKSRKLQRSATAQSLVGLRTSWGPNSAAGAYPRGSEAVITPGGLALAGFPSGGRPSMTADTGSMAHLRTLELMSSNASMPVDDDMLDRRPTSPSLGNVLVSSRTSVDQRWRAGLRRATTATQLAGKDGAANAQNTSDTGGKGPIVQVQHSTRAAARSQAHIEWLVRNATAQINLSRQLREEQQQQQQQQQQVDEGHAGPNGDPGMDAVTGDFMATMDMA